MLKRSRGMALVIVLMASVVLAMLSTALVGLNRAGFLSLNQYEDRAAALQACYAGLDYARARLVQEPYWGQAPLGATRRILDEPTIQVDEQGVLPGDNRITGRLLLAGSTFELKAENNLFGRFQLPAPIWSRTALKIPARCAYVAVEGRCGSARRRLETLLGRRTGVGGAIYAGKDLAISLAGGGTEKVLNFASTIPRGNLVKVNRDIRMPDPEQVDFGSLGGRGRVQSGNDTVVNSTFSFDEGEVVPGSEPGQSLMADAALTSSVSQEIKATVSTSAPPAPPKFRPEMLKTPAYQGPTLPAGKYHFVEPEKVIFTPQGGGSPQTFSNFIALNGAIVELAEYRFLPQGNVNVNGNLTLSGQQTENVYNYRGEIVSQTTVDVPVTLGVGYDRLGLPLSFAGLGTLTETKSRLTVTGNVTVKGDLVGSGQIFVRENASGQGGTLELAGNSFLSATRTDGMAVVADDKVIFGEVSEDTSTQMFAMLPDDFDLYKQALFPQSNYSTQARDTLANWQGNTSTNLRLVAGYSDNPATGNLRGSVLSGYNSIVEAMLPDGRTPKGKNLSMINVIKNMPDGSEEVVTAQQVLTEYLDFATSSGGMTLGRHTRLREFIKSLDRVNPNTDIVATWNPARYALSDATVQTLVVNQLTAYNQDARSRGKTLLDYMQSSAQYRESQRRDFIFGGLLYARGNVYTRLASSFNLLGTMISQSGTLGFDRLTSGQIVFDPTSFEDQFDINQLGLGPLFFWTGP